MDKRSPSRWWLRAGVVLFLLTGFLAFHLYNEGKGGCRPWQHIKSAPGEQWCESYF